MSHTIISPSASFTQPSGLRASGAPASQELFSPLLPCFPMGLCSSLHALCSLEYTIQMASATHCSLKAVLLNGMVWERWVEHTFLQAEVGKRFLMLQGPQHPWNTFPDPARSLSRPQSLPPTARGVQAREAGGEPGGPGGSRGPRTCGRRGRRGRRGPRAPPGRARAAPRRLR